MESLIDGMKMLTDQLNYANEKYKNIVDYLISMLDEFCRGVEVYSEQVIKRYPRLDFVWLDDGKACSQRNEPVVATIGRRSRGFDLNIIQISIVGNEESKSSDAVVGGRAGCVVVRGNGESKSPEI